MECFLVGKCQTDPGLVIWTGPKSEIPNGCEIGAPHGGILGGIEDGPELGDMECFLFGIFQIDPGLVIWTGPRSKIPNACEIGAPHGVCVGIFWSDPGSVMWQDVLL